MSIKKYNEYIKEDTQVESATYGGKGEFELPDSHLAAMKVTKGGSMCANCKWLSEDKTKCTNQYWIKWNGGDDIIPEPIDEYCSDWWMATK